MIVITDGESHDSPDLEKVIQQSERDNVTRYAVAVSSVLPALPPPRPRPQAASSLIDLYHQTPGGLQGGVLDSKQASSPSDGPLLALSSKEQDENLLSVLPRPIHNRPGVFPSFLQWF